MDATITPNRALSPRGFRILIGVVVAYNLAVAAFMFAIGAFPVPIFLGLDVLALAVAFLVLFRRQAGVSERVQVSAEEVRVLWESHGGSREAWRSQTALTRVAVEQSERSGARVRLSQSGRRVFVGQALSPRERADFGRALESAIAEARRERWPA